LKQLVNDEKNKAVYDSVEELKKNGQIGYEEPAVSEKLFECTIPAGQKYVIFGDYPGFTYIRGSALRLTVNGKSYDCTIKIGETSRIECSDANFPLNVSSEVDRREGDIVYLYLFYVSYKNPNEQDLSADCSVIVETIKEATIHTIDPKYLPSGPLYIELKFVGNYVNPGLDVLYQAIMERKPVNPIFMCNGNFTNKWDWIGSSGIFKVSFIDNATIYCNKRNDGTWNHNSP
jgi:hypothetical protein